MRSTLFSLTFILGFVFFLKAQPVLLSGTWSGAVYDASGEGFELQLVVSTSGDRCNMLRNNKSDAWQDEWADDQESFTAAGKVGLYYYVYDSPATGYSKSETINLALTDTDELTALF